MSTLTIASRYLMGRKLRAFLTTLAVMFGVFLIFGMNILVPAMVQSFKANALAASGQVDITITHKTGEAFSPALLDQVAAVDGVRAAAGYLNRPMNLPQDYFDHDPAKADSISVLSLIGLDPAAHTLHTYPIVEGRFLTPDDRDSAVITTSLADTLGLKLGDSLELPTTQGQVKLTIVGLMPARAIPGNEEVLVTLPEAQALLDQPGQINTIEANLNTTDPAKREEIQHKIETLLGENYHIGALPSGLELLSSIQIAEVALNLFGFMALLMGGFIIFNTFRTVVAERRHDIGLLRSIGASRRTIIGLILAEGFLQGIIGTAVGMALGYLLGVTVLAMLAPLLEKYIHLQMGGPVITLPMIIITVVLGVGVTLAAGLLPALSASRVTPLEALRPSVAGVETRRRMEVGAIVGAVLLVLAGLALVSGQFQISSAGLLLFLVGVVLVAPALVTPIARMFGALLALAFAREGTGTLAEANLSRQPSRAAITASATMIGLAVVVMMAGLTSSVRIGFLDVLKKSLGSDYLMIPPAVAVWGNNVGANADLADKLRELPGVAAVSTLRTASTQANGHPLSLLGIDPQVFPQVSELSFKAGDAATAYGELSAGRSVILNPVFAMQAGAAVGDDLQFITPEGTQTYRVVAIAGDYFNSKTPVAYTSQANLAADFHKTDDIFIQLNLKPGVDQTAADTAIRGLMTNYPQFRLVSGRAYYEENLRLFNVAFSAFNVLLAVMVLPSLIAMLNTLAISVIERTREIGMLRATGATRRQVRRMILAEAVLLAALGTAFGLLGGLYLGYVAVGGMSGYGFPVTYVFPLGGLLLAIAVGLLFGALAAIIPARQAARMEIVQALRYE